jgi:hypothetical protein
MVDSGSIVPIHPCLGFDAARCFDSEQGTEPHSKGEQQGDLTSALRQLVEEVDDGGEVGHRLFAVESILQGQQRVRMPGSDGLPTVP